MPSTDFDAEVQRAVAELAPIIHQMLSIVHARLNVNADGSPPTNYAALSFVCQPLLGTMNEKGEQNGGYVMGPVMVATNMPSDLKDMHTAHVDMLRNALHQVKSHKHILRN